MKWNMTGGQRRFGLLLASILLGWGAGVAQATPNFDPATHAEIGKWLDDVTRQGLARDDVRQALEQARFRQEVLDAMQGAAEHRLSWHEYRDIFVQPKRIRQGVAFIEAHREAFSRAEQEFGVPPAYIAAIIGVETFYGQYKGDHRVLDSLATLAFYHPSRGDFFSGELAAFLEITFEQGIPARKPEGSYAGAMGYPQFIPTSYQAYAVDFDGDGRRDLWDDPVDAIGSVGNYFAEHGWRRGAPVVTPAEGPETPPGSIDFNATRPPYADASRLAQVGIVPRVGAVQGRVIPLALARTDGRYRYALGHRNFYVITRYNHSYLYAMAVTELASRIQAALDEVDG
ncbi:membrane-bound lytic murein transglycosylase B [Chromohalobacter marismortui]|uniref:Membrane-bound lytic murein transglycosylase B n=1 Tax=Chromohalobacter marismortui TaxID=42055 RepID=A0A4R7NVF9_9GAMM|nr:MULTISPECIES: lytic murein transglycosylase B [Chromohalobacter]MCI0510426.1 lytic murein transglycosylase B [Chromohalobacter sp.]MCI0594680.1 lytic murein transglycosylase B [Chromohalobacter sp.]TDU24998.1 membrane-bound lytic murein transglycosylase B [Chromohalobacter marismortui]